MKALLDHLNQSKAWYGGLLVVVGGWAKVSFPQYAAWGDLALLVGGFLSGAGLMKSDKDVKSGQ